MRAAALAALSQKSPWDAYEEILKSASEIARSICGESNVGKCERTLKAFSLAALAEIAKSRMLYGKGMPSQLLWISELKVDGTLVGLSDRLSVDAVLGLSLVIEFKAGVRRDFHKLALAGYALAIESHVEVPIDYGALIYMEDEEGPELRIETLYIGPDLRKQFIDWRDEMIELILSERDPGVARNCPGTCPFLEICGKPPGVRL